MGPAYLVPAASVEDATSWAYEIAAPNQRSLPRRPPSPPPETRRCPNCNVSHT
jgi:hypothetical protein